MINHRCSLTALCVAQAAEILPQDMLVLEKEGAVDAIVDVGCVLLDHGSSECSAAVAFCAVAGGQPAFGQFGSDGSCVWVRATRYNTRNLMIFLIQPSPLGLSVTTLGVCTTLPAARAALPSSFAKVSKG